MANTLLDVIIVVFLWSLCGNLGLAHKVVHIFARSCSHSNVTEEGRANYLEKYWKLINEMKGEMGRNMFSFKELGDPPNRIYVFSQCMNDLSASECRDCFGSLQDLLPHCLPAKGGRVSADGCFLRVDNYSFYQENIGPGDLWGCSDGKAQEAKEFTSLAIHLIDQMAKQAPVRGGYISMEGCLPSGVKIYGLASCWKTLDHDMCSACLADAASASISCLPSTEAYVLNSGCVLRYADYDFSSHDAKSKKARDTMITRTAYVLAATAMCSLIITVGYYVCKSIYKLCSRQRKTKGSPKGLEMISSAIKRSSWFMQFEYSTLEKATNGFNELHKLGQGGYGAVYKGTLPDGREIAIKRFFVYGREGKEEVYNEIDVYSRAQHKNLVRILGCSFTADESFLVYEFLANKSLNYVLFDPEKKSQLNWPRRHRIIIGTAEGLEYLHINSEVPIIHRDIKASNILLDTKYKPKISDFGLAKLNSSASTSIVGTLGYMAPEYLAGCQATEKVDVYSFGILVLEIVTGMENRTFESAEETLETLGSHAWKHFQSNTTSEIIDESMEDKDVEEIKRVIHVGLLCAQELSYLRPTMTEVIRMLRQKDIVMPLPSKPPFTEDFSESSQLDCSRWLPQHVHE